MTHFVGLVLAKSEGDLERLLAPYNENTEVTPYFRPLSEDDLVLMADHYKIDRSDTTALLAKMPDWCGCPGEEQNGQIGRVTTYNPNSKWDWYVVGGRWEDIVPNNFCKVADIPKFFKDYLPSVIVDATGWHSSKDWGWWGTSMPTDNPDVVQELLAKHKDDFVYVVDFHI